MNQRTLACRYLVARLSTIGYARKRRHVDELRTTELAHRRRVDLDRLWIDSDDKLPRLHIVKKLLQKGELLVEERTTDEGRRWAFGNQRTDPAPQIRILTCSRQEDPLVRLHGHWTVEPWDVPS